MAIPLQGITREARLYALHELCRRSGLDEADFHRNWEIEDTPDGLALRLISATRPAGQIVFPDFSRELNQNLVVKKAWPGKAPAKLLNEIPDFIVPYARKDSIPNQPLFVETAPGKFSCTEDLLASTVAALSRFEEIDSSQKDQHGRFQFNKSLAFRDKYIDRPIVDEYGLALEHLSHALVPGWVTPARTMRIKFSHDIDEIGIPFHLRITAGHFLKRHAYLLGVRDLLSVPLNLSPGYLSEVQVICTEAIRRGIRSALYWKASKAGPYDSGYDVRDRRVARVMDWARDRGIELGVHPGYNTFLCVSELKNEVERCKAAIGKERIGGRQHYLRWSPQTWAHWEECGLVYDSTVGYAEHAGFRAGTSWPYFPWLWNDNRRAELLEIPLIVMDVTLVEYMALSPQSAQILVRDLARKCKIVGGVFTLLWHNSCLVRPYNSFFRVVLDELAGFESYDWESGVRSMKSFCAATL